MSIAPSTRSCGLPGEGNRSWGAVRSLSSCSEAKRGDPPRTAKARAVAKANPIRPRYAKPVAANLPEMPKPATYGEVRSECTCRVTRGGWGLRVPKERSRSLGGPVRGSDQERAAKAGAWSRVAACGGRDMSGSAPAPQPEPACRSSAGGESITHSASVAGSRNGPYELRSGAMPVEQRGRTSVVSSSREGGPLEL